MGKSAKDVPAITIVEKNVVTDNNFVAVEVATASIIDGSILEGPGYVGVSHRHPEDKFVPEVGHDLAYWRAVEKMAKAHIKTINGYVADVDNKRKSLERQSIPRFVKGGVWYMGKFYPSAIGIDENKKIYKNPKKVVIKSYMRDFNNTNAYALATYDVGVYSGKSVVVFHPYVNWMDGYVTIWPESDLRYED